MKISFHGGVEGVTGSCHLLTGIDSEGAEHKILVDCGMFQAEQMCATKNGDQFEFDAKEIEAVFITHPHADHTGRLPKLMKEGFEGSVYMLEPCLGLTKLVLEDAFHIMSEDAKRCGSSVLYELEDLVEVFERTKTVGYHEQVEIAPGFIALFHEAGHVLGSSYISFQDKDKKVIFSGDIGNDEVPILPDTEPISSADVVVCESTYGGRHHEDRSTRVDKLREEIEQVIKDKATLMIPAFSIERTQELLYEIDLILKDVKTSIPIFLDSPMAIKATDLYRHFNHYLKFDANILQEKDRDFFSFPNLRETLSRDESKTINDTPTPKIIIAGSGMMSGGRIMHHLIRYLPDGKNRLLIIGYQAKGTLGRKIYEGAKKVKIFREEVRVNAQVNAIGSFSAHGDTAKLTKWLQPTDGKIPEKIVLVHGDPEAKELFATHLRHNLKTEVLIPRLKEEIEL